MPDTEKRTLLVVGSGKGARESSPSAATNTLQVADLARVVYSAGKVFEELQVGRDDTDNFLRSGSLNGITSRSDLALLEDLRDVSQFIITNRETPIGSTYVRAVNAQITRSGPLNPGLYRTAAQQIGVNTHYGRHEPQPSSDTALQRIIVRAMTKPSPREQALELFVQIAKAQPFEDGNKRTALFVANSVLIRERQPEMLVVPVDENDDNEAARFSGLLARAYVLDDLEGVKNLLRGDGFTKHITAREPKRAARMSNQPELQDVTLEPHGLSSE